MSTTSLQHNLTTTVRVAPLITPSFTQSLTILQMPILELSEWLQKQLEENPLVEIIQENSPLTGSRVIERSCVVEKRDLSKEKSLHEHLESQARLFFSNPEDLQQALTLIANLDDRGFLPSDILDSPVLTALQSFDPAGICARSLQESLIQQINQKGLHHSLAFVILSNHFNDLIHHRFSKIRKHLHCTEDQLDESLHVDIASLSLNPASRFFITETILSIPDLFLVEEEGIWKAEVNQAYLPRVRLRHTYALSKHKARKSLSVNLQDIAPSIENEQAREARDYLRKCYKEASQLLHSVKRRSATLIHLGNYLIRTQKAFLDGDAAQPNYLTIRETAQALKLHPATIARAVAHKNVSCSHYGIIALKFFFRRPTGSHPENPNDIGEAIAAIVAKESTIRPLSDEQIAEKLRACGVICARRTVSKYRRRQKISSATIRKNRHRE